MSSRAPTPAEVIARLGRIATARELAAVCGRHTLTPAVVSGQVVRVARGYYALPDLPDPRLTAARLQGVVSHASAARLWDLPVLGADRSTHVTLPPHRKSRGRSASLHWMQLTEDEVVAGVTSPLRTVIDCARTLPFAEALAIADAALRLRLVGRSGLVSTAEAVAGAGRRRARVVIRAADGRAGSALESVLRALLLTERIRCFTPQLDIADEDFRARVDLGDPLHRIVLEADSFEHHGHWTALVRDCRRYDELVVRGWLVLRFAWEQVMFEPEWVIATVLAALRERSPAGRRTVPGGLWTPQSA